MSEPISFVIDTNTLVSAVIRPDSVPDRAYKKAATTGLIVYSDETLEEMKNVLERKKFDKYVLAHRRDAFIDAFKKIAERFDAPQFPTPICRDPKDDKYLALAVASQSKFIITGDADLLVLNPFDNISILTPSDFLQLVF